jgi:hypothetical protein
MVHLPGDPGRWTRSISFCLILFNFVSVSAEIQRLPALNPLAIAPMDCIGVFDKSILLLDQFSVLVSLPPGAKPLDNHLSGQIWLGACL